MTNKSNLPCFFFLFQVIEILLTVPLPLTILVAVETLSFRLWSSLVLLGLLDLLLPLALLVPLILLYLVL